MTDELTRREADAHLATIAAQMSTITTLLNGQQDWLIRHDKEIYGTDSSDGIKTKQGKLMQSDKRRNFRETALWATLIGTISTFLSDLWPWN